MSRIGRHPITIPANVTVKLDGENVTVKGPLGELHLTISKEITAVQENDHVVLSRNSDDREIRSKHGLYRALIANMVTGVTEGYSKTLVVSGVGYKVSKQGKKVVLNIGFSHSVEVEEIDGISLSCPSATEIVVKGIDKNEVGQFALKIRDLKPVEPYHGYGIRYSDEVVVKKEGKTAGKK
ncbi:MAG: 50S ribosomal protein L6 [Clostridia bacterium]|jgi:large subunit ribosomal protein L6|nr:50S ribosomal protein L6 [Clostridia bacterium]MDD4275566.1 50S ribosomal protein L6 [Clostridia bacterium]